MFCGDVRQGFVVIESNRPCVKYESTLVGDLWQQDPRRQEEGNKWLDDISFLARQGEEKKHV